MEPQQAGRAADLNLSSSSFLDSADRSLLELGLRNVTAEDTYGYELLERRIEAIPILLEEVLSTPVPDVNLPGGQVSVFGIGSSKSHAHYFSALLNQIPGYQANVVDMRVGERTPVDGSPVVFSQGLSNNIHSILREQIGKQAGIVFTAHNDCAQDNLKGRLLGELRQSEVSVVQFPLENEYEILVRSVGPFFGYVAAYRVAQQLAPETFQPLSVDMFSDALCSARSVARDLTTALSRDMLAGKTFFVADAPLNDSLGNIRMKFLEGLMVDRPDSCSFIEFSHGPFQFVNRNGGVVFLFVGESRQEQDVAQALREDIAAQAGGTPVSVFPLSSNLPAPLQILEYEMIFNHLILDKMKEAGAPCDQRKFSEARNYETQF